MSRVVIKIAQRPYKLMTTEGEKKICMCGLSKNQPFCDGSHHKTDGEDADTLYQYDEAGERMALEEDDEECCCGDKCCSDDKDGESCCCGDGCCTDDACACDDESEVTEKTEPKKHSHSK